jgi:hypothetical protein
MPAIDLIAEQSSSCADPRAFEKCTASGDAAGRRKAPLIQSEY